MICPKCHHKKTKVVDSRPVEGEVETWRVRKCLCCEYRFTTTEVNEDSKSLAGKLMQARKETILAEKKSEYLEAQLQRISGITNETRPYKE